MSAGYICAACGETFTGGGRWLQSGYHGGTAPMQWWDLCPECMDGFAKWLDCYRESAREHSLESESVREQSESVRERRYESQDVTGDAGRVTESPEMSHDTREKLEKDLKTHLYEFGGYCFSSREGHTDNVDTFFDDFVSLLDRQASITERETKLRELYKFEENHREHVRSIEAVNQELNAELADARESLEAAWEDNAELGDQVDELTKQLDDLRIYRDTWEHTAHLHEKDIERLVEERDQWKDAFEDSEHMRLELVEQVEYHEALIARLKQRRGELMEQVRMLQDDAARARREA